MEEFTYQWRKPAWTFLRILSCITLSPPPPEGSVHSSSVLTSPSVHHSASAHLPPSHQQSLHVFFYWHQPKSAVNISKVKVPCRPSLFLWNSAPDTHLTVNTMMIFSGWGFEAWNLLRDSPVQQNISEDHHIYCLKSYPQLPFSQLFSHHGGESATVTQRSNMRTLFMMGKFSSVLS